jgi:3-methyladenine DNA glycosylase AlkD
LLTVQELLSELRRLGEPQRVAALKRVGAASPAFGVSLPELRALAKQIGPDHDLALALWDTGVREARILAALIDERDRVTEEQMDHAEGFGSEPREAIHQVVQGNPDRPIRIVVESISSRREALADVESDRGGGRGVRRGGC